MERSDIIRIPVNDMEAVYRIDENGNVSFMIIPAKGGEKQGDEPQPDKLKPDMMKSGKIYPDKIHSDPLVQISCSGDASCIGFCAGETRHNSALTMSFKYISQEITEENGEKKIITTVRSDAGITARHVLVHSNSGRAVRVFTEVSNESEIPVTIEALSSVNISGLTPYTNDEGRGRLKLHRFRSRWSEEGRHEVRSAEELLLEPSWADFGVRCEKFGCLGSMPVRGYFPFAAVEDEKEGVFWAISLACPSSWQIETIRIDKGLSLSAGLADYEFGHWRKTLEAGEEFITPECYLTAGKCDFLTVCDRLLDIQRDKLSDTRGSIQTDVKKDKILAVGPDKELPDEGIASLPAIFNEYCTTWGEPSEAVITCLLDKIKGTDFEYFVIDAGWYRDPVKGWQDNMGDWNLAEDLFPNGIKKVVDMINEAGMKAGIWFELEVVGKDSDKADDNAHLLTRDGKVIVSGTRRFWDMRNGRVKDYLGRKVIDFLNENGFKYIKIDYNDTIGIGCDGAESYGEGLRSCINATQEFYRRIREEVPGIAIEVCSSGGHRLEPSFMELADYLSFSDAHEEKEIPVIAADLQALVLAQKSQIWSVLRKDDALKRIAYSVCAGMYGVLCISGDIFELNDAQWKLALEGVDFYKKASPVIIDGFTYRFGPFQYSNRDLKDYQAGVRYGKDGKALVIVHSFEHEGIQKVTVPLRGEYSIVDKYETGDHRIRIAGDELIMEFDETFDALALLLKSENISR